MKIRITDILETGRDLDFELSQALLNARLNSAANREKLRDSADRNNQQVYFNADAFVNCHLELEGSTVICKGTVKGSYSTSCARCAEDFNKSIELPVFMLLKPSTVKTQVDADSSGSSIPESEIEDVSIGFYREQEVDLGAIFEEALVLAIPYADVCQENCKGLCHNCGINLNKHTCHCEGVKKQEATAFGAQLKAALAQKN